VTLKSSKNYTYKIVLWNLCVGTVFWEWLYISLSIIDKINNTCIYVGQGSGFLPLPQDVQDVGKNTELID
jgi:hypothetical protein